MKSEKAFFDSFEENYEKLTKIDNNQEYLMELEKNMVIQDRLISALEKRIGKKEAMHLVESLTDSFHFIQSIKNRETFIYAYKEGVKFGISLKDNNNVYFR